MCVCIRQVVEWGRGWGFGSTKNGRFVVNNLIADTSVCRDIYYRGMVGCLSSSTLDEHRFVLSRLFTLWLCDYSPRIDCSRSVKEKQDIGFCFHFIENV